MCTLVTCRGRYARFLRSLCGGGARRRTPARTAGAMPARRSSSSSAAGSAGTCHRSADHCHARGASARCLPSVVQSLQAMLSCGPQVAVAAMGARLRALPAGCWQHAPCQARKSLPRPVGPTGAPRSGATPPPPRRTPASARARAGTRPRQTCRCPAAAKSGPRPPARPRRQSRRGTRRAGPPGAGHRARAAAAPAGPRAPPPHAWPARMEQGARWCAARLLMVRSAQLCGRPARLPRRSRRLMRRACSEEASAGCCSPPPFHARPAHTVIPCVTAQQWRMGMSNTSVFSEATEVTVSRWPRGARRAATLSRPFALPTPSAPCRQLSEACQHSPRKAKGLT